EVVLRSGTLLCAHPADAGEPLREGETLLWTKEQGAPITVEPIALEDGGLRVVMHGETAPSRAGTQAPATSVPQTDPAPHAASIPWLPVGMIAGTALLAGAAVFFARRQPPKTKTEAVQAGRRQPIGDTVPQKAPAPAPG